MNIARSIRISRKQLAAHKLRTALALTGIVIGVSAVIIMVAIGNGAQQEVLSKIEAMGTDLLIVNAGQVQKSAGRQQIRGTVTTLALADVEAIARECSAVKVAAPVQSKKIQVKYGNLSTNTTVVGTTTEFQEVRNFRIAAGAFFTDDENLASRRAAVLGQSVVNNLFEGRNPIGETIRVGRVPFEIIGVMESKGVDLNGADQDDQIFIPIRTALRRVFNVSYIGAINIRATNTQAMRQAVAQVSELLRDRHRLNKQQKPDDFTIQNQADLLVAQRETTNTFTMLIGSIASISLLVGGIGILAIMLIAIRERTNEIGLRMAVGASRKDIMTQFVIEASILGVGGGLVGIFLGVLGAVVVRFGTSWAVTISPNSVALAFGFSLLVGLFFGVYPARRASLLDPIEALRSE
ncbi:MAG: ABC transporter permease [Ignavibacteriae bacterium]|nr:ABC transporter permease [Ignavibacteriota bacterium]